MKKITPVLVALLAFSFLPLSRAEQVVDAIDVQVIMPAPNGEQAKVKAIVDATGSVSEIKITNPGNGYGFVPRISVSCPPENMGITPILSQPVLADGKVVRIDVIDGGKGYNPKFPPEIKIQSPNRRAEAGAILSTDTLKAIQIIDPGSGYVPIGRSKNPILGSHTWSGGIRVWINDIRNEGFASGQSIRIVDADGKVKGTGTIQSVSSFSRGKPKDSDSSMVNLSRAFQGKIDNRDYLEFSGYTVNFRPAKDAKLLLSSENVVNYGLGTIGEQFLVENGNGYVTLRGLPTPETSRAMVRTLGYYEPGDGGGGVFYWNPSRQFAMVRKLILKSGGQDYRPGDVVLLNGRQRFLVWDIHKKKSERFPEGLYTDYMDFSPAGKVDLGAISQLRPVQFFDFGKSQKSVKLQNSQVAWSKTSEKPIPKDGPGSGQPFVKGSEAEVEVVWANDNGGSFIAPCGYSGAGRWDRLYENERNDIRYYGAVADADKSATDNTWPMQMALVSCSTIGDPACGRELWLPNGGGSYMTGTINVNYPANIKGNGGVLLSKPGEDVFSTIVSPIDYPFNKNNIRGRVHEGFQMIIDESVDPTGLGGVADRNSWRARRLYKGMRFDKEHNSQRWASLTFMEAEPVSDRRYFGTDDGLDPEKAPPINDVEPARRLYYIIGNHEFSDHVVELSVDPNHRGFARHKDRVTLEGGVPLFGSRVGPGKPGLRSNFGKPDAGKVVALVESLFVPEKSRISHKKGCEILTLSGGDRVPLLEGSFYLVGARHIPTDADPKPGSGKFALFPARCVKTDDGSLVLSMTTGQPARKIEMIDSVNVKRSDKKRDVVAIENGNSHQHSAVTAILAVGDSEGNLYRMGEDYVIRDINGKVVRDPSKLSKEHYQKPKTPAERGKTEFIVEWLKNSPQKGNLYEVAFSFIGPTPLDGFTNAPAQWVGGPADKLSIVKGLKGSYKYRPGAAEIRHLKSKNAVTSWNPKNFTLMFDGDHSLTGFTVGMRIEGEKSGAQGRIKAFEYGDKTARIILNSWNLINFRDGEYIQPVFNEKDCLGGNSASRLAAGRVVLNSDADADIIVDSLFVSQNPVRKSMTITVARSSNEADKTVLDANNPLTKGKNIYPWRITKINDEKGQAFSPNLDYRTLVDSRNKTINVRWDGNWKGKSAISKVPKGDYSIEFEYFTGSPTYSNLPYPGWIKVEDKEGQWTFVDEAFLGAEDGQIVMKDSFGKVTGSAWKAGKDFDVKFDPLTETGSIIWKSVAPEEKGSFYLKYRKRVDDYDNVPWGSPKHLSNYFHGAVLVDAQERFMGNFGWIDQTINFPGYPPALGLGGMNVTFEDLRIFSKGATQSTSGGIHIWANYDGNHENIFVQDTNYGFVMPVNLYYPWQNYGVSRDGTTENKAPTTESDVAYGNTGWGGNGCPDCLPNRYQSLLPYTGGSEQSYFKDFQFRCGDVGLFVVDSAFYEMRNIWASGAWSIDRPRGSVMVFGTPANGVEQFTHAGQFGPLGSMFGEQALNGDYALPAIRCCACGGGGREVDFGGVTQGRQAIWSRETVGKAAGGRSSVFVGRWKYGMGIWGPDSLRISFEKDSKKFAIDAVGFGADTKSFPPLRDGGTYYIIVQNGSGKTLQTSFVYDVKKPMNAQTLKDAPKFSAKDATARVINSTVYTQIFTPVERKKLLYDYGWSLLLCGDNNEFRVSPTALEQRKRLILEPNGRNKISSNPFN